MLQMPAPLKVLRVVAALGLCTGVALAYWQPRWPLLGYWLLLSIGLGFLGVGPAHQLLLVAAMCIVSAWLGWKLHLACD